MVGEHVLIAGGSGVVGAAAARRCAALGDVEVTVLSRRPPRDLPGARHLALDLTDADACAEAAAGFSGVTSLVYAALFEKPGLVAGWLEQDQIQTNQRMLENLFEPLEGAAPGLRHVTLLQGTKAYGAHVRRIPLPAREDRDEDRSTPNFYWLQEDYIRAKQAGRPWAWTILRPQIIFGEALGAAMNLIPAIGAYAAVLKADRAPLHFPGGADTLLEAVDADLLAGVIEWAGRSEAAWNQIFNVTNGDVYTWRNVWPAIADALGMAPGEDRPTSVAAFMADRTADWDRVRAAQAPAAPALDAFVGEGFHYADMTMAYGATTAPGVIAGAALVSTIKLRRAGFTEVMDTEDMFRKWFAAFQSAGLLPPR